MLNGGALARTFGEYKEFPSKLPQDFLIIFDSDQGQWENGC